MKLEQGKFYDLESLVYLGWMKDGKPMPTLHGYNVEDYFSPDGTYQGPDDEGIEPILEDSHE